MVGFVAVVGGIMAGIMDTPRVLPRPVGIDRPRERGATSAPMGRSVWPDLAVETSDRPTAGGRR